MQRMLQYSDATPEGASVQDWDVVETDALEGGCTPLIGRVSRRLQGSTQTENWAGEMQGVQIHGTCHDWIFLNLLNAMNRLPLR